MGADRVVRGDTVAKLRLVGERKRADRSQPAGLLGRAEPGVDGRVGGEWTAVVPPISDVHADETLLSADGLFAEVDAE